ncbi:enterobactin exporter EntS [Serratia liquefaciens]|nr:enterobactin exporter EntS [Serratia liquefaciens]
MTSGQLAQTVRPGALMLATTVGSFVAIALFSLMPHWALGALCLALFGWLSAISSLLQYTLIQTQTPEHMLGGLTVCGPRKTSPATPSARRCSAA